MQSNFRYYTAKWIGASPLLLAKVHLRIYAKEIAIIQYQSTPQPAHPTTL